MLARVGSKGRPCALLVRVQAAVATVGNGMKLAQKIKNTTAFGPRDPTSVDTPEESQNTNQKEYLHPYVHCSYFQ